MKTTSPNISYPLLHIEQQISTCLQRMSSTTFPTTEPLTVRTPPYTYLHLSLLSSSSLPTCPPLDALTAHKYLNSALRQFLGITGTAIPIDILKVEARDVWIRVPREDGGAVVAALGSWVGSGDGGSVSWRVKGRGEWLGAVLGREGVGRVWGA